MTEIMLILTKDQAENLEEILSDCEDMGGCDGMTYKSAQLVELHAIVQTAINQQEQQ